MKIAVIILSILILAFGAIVYIQSSAISDYKSHISTLNDDNTALTNENIALHAKANLKSFENTKTLERFLKGSMAIKKSDPYGYASESCIELMKEARDSGYWMGLTSINASDESIYSAMLRRQKGYEPTTWHVFNVAIVGDADIYLVDSQDANNYYLLSTMTGDFAEYNKDSESNIDNLNIH